MEHGLQTSLKIYACFMKDKMAAGGLRRATNYGGDCVICLQIPECISLQSLLCRFVSRTSDSSQKKKKDTEYNSVPQSIMVVEKILYWQKYHFSFREDLVSATPLFLFTSGHAINWITQNKQKINK